MSSAGLASRWQAAELSLLPVNAVLSEKRVHEGFRNGGRFGRGWLKESEEAVQAST